MPEPRRVVVTGLGAVTPVGNTAPEAWTNLLAGCSGIDNLTLFDTSAYGVKIGGEVRNFKAEDHIASKELRHMDRSAKFGLVAAKEAVADAGLNIAESCPERVGIIMGTAAGGVDRILSQHQVLLERGPDRVSPMFLPHFLPDSASGLVAIALGAEGPNMAVASACATGSHAVGEAFKTVLRDDADVMVAGGTEASILPVIFAGFINMRALSSRNGDPKKASRPFDADRDGFVIAEGAAVLVLEDLEHARKRGARIYCEVVGYGSGNDAFHMVQPKDQGAGAAKVMRQALRDASRTVGLVPEQIGYINAHGTSTPYNDRFETAAIKDVFGEHARHLAVSSTKSMTGHMFGAAGAFEALACVKALETGWLPPTINYETPDPECDLDYVPNKARRWQPTAAMSNSFGLGGHNATVVLKVLETAYGTRSSGVLMYGHRVVVTGLGAMTPIGQSVDEYWANLRAGVSGVARIALFDPEGLPVQIAAEVKNFDPGNFMDRKAARRMERFSQFSIAAAGQAIEDARLKIDDSNAWDVGAIIATGGGGIRAVADEMEVLVTKGWERVGPMMVPMLIPNMASCQVSMAYGIKGPVVTNTAACAAGVYSLFEALHFLRRGDISAAVTGGTESAMLPLAFISMARTGALSRRNDDPQTASRPFDKDRDGFVFGEGSGMMVLETLEHAQKRGARILAELRGASITADAYHVSAPEPSGESAKRAILKAIEDAEMRPDEIDYVCAHGTGTPLNDSTETKALKLALGEHAYRIPVSSVKSMVGHLLGAAGALSAVAAVKALETGCVPPTINQFTADPECDLDYVPWKARKVNVQSVIVNGFGFGGQNSVAVFRKFEE